MPRNRNGLWPDGAIADCETPSAVLEGFTLTGGTGTLHTGMQLEEDLPRDNIVGGGMYCHDASPTVRNCWFVSNMANYAAGIFVDGCSSRIEDCEFRTNVSGTYGSAIGGPASPLVIARCLFASNEGGDGDGAVHVTGSLRVEDCIFRGNRARAGGALNAGDYTTSFSVSRCIFVDNSTHETHGGAVRVHEGTLTMDGCLFERNVAAVDGGAVMFIDGANGSVRNCTFIDNDALRWGGHIACYSSNPAITNCIFAHALSHGGLYCSFSSPVLSCNDAWENVDGNYIGIEDPTGTMGNISADPLFCDPPLSDYSIDAQSPCAPDHDPQCGLIGAYAVGCASTPTEGVSWGSLKSNFRR